MMVSLVFRSSVRTILFAGSVAACGGGARSSSRSSPSPERARRRLGQEVDCALEVGGGEGPPRANGVMPLKVLERVLLEIRPRRSARDPGPLLPGRGAFRSRQPPRGGARVPPGLRRDAESIRWRPRRCSVSVTSTPISGAGPELDPSYGQTALATYQELLNRYPGGSAAARAQQRIARAAGALRVQGVPGRALLLPPQGVRLGRPLPEGLWPPIPGPRSRPRRW